MKAIRFFTKHVAIRYIISGGTAAMTQLSIVFILNTLNHIHYLIAATAGFLCAFVVSYTLHKSWTFRREDVVDELIHRQVGLYFFTSLCALVLNDFLMYIFVHHMHIMVLLAQIYVGLIVACISFFVSRNIVFKYNREHHVQ